ncbi:SH3 domain-containing protein [Tropicimonas marinistellae]|uniref:SH3 domain-containing protein n=1 Tax=Tropicimonas marinistellae TaxID=1739787 RepID=UPI000835A7B7|nr:SH3 domain-containing protein [Tropicimonas marinistellae]
MGLQASPPRLRGLFGAFTVILLALAAGAAFADGNGTDGSRGSVTNLPLPRYVSLKAAEGNARRGPSLSHRIDWVYKRRALPLQVTAEFGHWRRVRDRDGAGGWMHYSLLSGARTVLVEQDMVALRARPANDSMEVAKVQSGVVARLGECTPGWCRITAGGERGWVRKTALWGVGADELRE